LRFILSGLGNWYNGWSLTDQAVQLADKLGFWGAVIPDHYMWAEAYGQPQKDSTLESWIALSYLAAKTQNIKLGTIVTPIPFRPPAMLAKMVSTMDVLSSGRAVLGVGAGWSQTEFEGYSIRRLQHMRRSENTGPQDPGGRGTNSRALAEATS